MNTTSFTVFVSLFTRGGSLFATFLFIKQLFKTTLSPFQEILSFIHDYLFPQIHINIPEYEKGSWHSNTFYTAIETYLSSTAAAKASRLKATGAEEGETVALSIDENECVRDLFSGVAFEWGYHCTQREKSSSDKYYYTLSFNHKHRNLVSESYLQHIIQTSRELSLKNRKRNIYTNSMKEDKWTYVTFKHPTTFQTLAMEENRKKEIMSDLTSFRNSKDYYAKMGKAWKRGYLLYGEPGTCKSTMIASMSNFLEYDIYDLELTAVSNNISLRKLLTKITNKSILVIEDIDCSRVSGTRKAKEKEETEKDSDKEGIDGSSTTKKKEKKKEDTSVTLSGLLNFIDGLWSAGGEERIVVFTTNHVNKLDPALVRRGRMDMHIELSYCGFEAFKVLTKNYLDIDSHPLFEEVQELLKTTNITPADVAEVLMCDTTKTIDSQETERLEELVRVLKKSKRKGKCSNGKDGDGTCIEKYEDKDFC